LPAVPRLAGLPADGYIFVIGSAGVGNYLAAVKSV